MISVKKLNKSFNGVIVLNDISTEFENGKTNLIIGQSGSGKTVLLKCILGLFTISIGFVVSIESGMDISLLFWRFLTATPTS